MRCDACGSIDSVFFIKPDGAGGEQRLCRRCALARGYAVGGDGVLGAIVDPDPGEGPEPVCRDCGWTAERLRATGRLGCSSCASTFRSLVSAMLARAGARGAYDGKVPRTAAPARDADGSRAAMTLSLERAVARDADGSRAAMTLSLERAVAREDFETAASIRDRLRAAAAKARP
ncbi:MAG TPA: UvrB/UvrC motif-containing protein [Spirochaetales bacterium]|nr:UvrB/UvrC motif-containing protein [Spirochaetales bacterium]